MLCIHACLDALSIASTENTINRGLTRRDSVVVPEIITFAVHILLLEVFDGVHDRLELVSMVSQRTGNIYLQSKIRFTELSLWYRSP